MNLHSFAFSCYSLQSDPEEWQFSPTSSPAPSTPTISPAPSSNIVSVFDPDGYDSKSIRSKEDFQTFLKKWLDARLRRGDSDAEDKYWNYRYFVRDYG